MSTSDFSDAADRNWRRFVLFRVLFNSRFYYPVLAVLFLDLGLSAHVIPRPEKSVLATFLGR